MLRKNDLEPIQPRKISHRASTTLYSSRAVNQDPLKLPEKPKKKTKFPYSGLSIGYMKLNNRLKKPKTDEVSPVKYSHFFSDMYFDSETISFPKVEGAGYPDQSDKKPFFLPSKLNFRRLKHKIWTDIKPKEEEMPGINSFTSRSAGRAYDLQSKKKELIPVTKFRSQDHAAEGLGLRVKGLLKALKSAK
jgi:hypothetical protein